MPRSRSLASGFFHEMQNTVWPRSTSCRISEFAGDRSRM
jgi:hypothetical protein